jgi:type VI secretion system protein ImpK
MTLLELCEPLFQYVSRLSRLSRMGQSMEMGQVRSDIKRIFEEMKASTSSAAELISQYEKVELPLIFFVDFMIKESRLSFAAEWMELGRERNELAGDEKFFDLLDADLADPSDAATQRLVIFYTCLGLGFTGIYTG